MAHIFPFRGLRPKPEYARHVASPPYDVIDSDKARELAHGNPISFLYITKPEINFEKNKIIQREEIYQKGAECLKRLIGDGILVQDREPCFYIYHQIMKEHQQAGVVACSSVDDYLGGMIKKHEHTHPEKVQDRFQLIKTLGVQTGPIFLTYRHKKEIDDVIQKEMCNDPIYDFTYHDAVRHRLFKISNQDTIKHLMAEFNTLNALYIADGHHRCEAAAQVCLYHRSRNSAHTGQEQYNTFLSVIFPDTQTQILPYNRVVQDLAGFTPDALVQTLQQKMQVRTTTSKDYRPASQRTIGMYLDHTWYELAFPETLVKSLPTAKQLDVGLLQEFILAPLLHIHDPRTDDRIKFVGGLDGIERICELVNKGDFAVAFSLYPTSIKDIMQVADAGGVMPPKSTWFEPKLLSGLYTHIITESFSNNGE